MFYNIIKKPNNTADILEGNTLIIIDEQVYHIENNVYNNFVIKKKSKP